MLQVGERAPEFTATTDAGTTISLADFRGRKVVLYFYPKDDTPGCTREACSFRDHYQALLDRGAVVLGVSTDSVTSHARFKQKYGLPFPLVSDESRTIVTAYGVWKEKQQYGRTFMGTERTTFIIDEHGTITHIFPRVRVDGHTEEVLAALSGAPQQLSLIPTESALAATVPPAVEPSAPPPPVEAAGPARRPVRKAPTPARRRVTKPIRKKRTRRPRRR